ncbi:outer membrane lipopolysaccharide assembly protein LptE/RlpB [Litorivivens lipolytica]|uniref:LPS-assembly lipoprotein LptE n=1 Tax=Litorivivens lipolytica TaxID=1524264 RepID=A0A7W4Z6I7_9GAMM|nr:LPS assembly lipoprotein LptE [Litorivivens lipolytica]MBB3046951.1 outer membrane lipopolysaccharide assembly protein LptE/RlpB [Litorivivens lipolytica]
MPRLLLVLLISALVGCGFQLRGSPALSGKGEAVHVVQAHADNPLRRRISQQIAMYNLQAVKRNEASYRFVISEVERTDTVLSLDSDARTAERRLLIEADLSLFGEDDQLLQNQRIREQRILFTDPDNPVGDSIESQLVINELEDATAQRIALLLARWLDKLEPPAQ